MDQIAEYTYQYDAALKQLNIKPESLTITEDSDSESGYQQKLTSNENHNYFNLEIQRAREAETEL